MNRSVGGSSNRYMTSHRISVATKTPEKEREKTKSASSLQQILTFVLAIGFGIFMTIMIISMYEGESPLKMIGLEYRVVAKGLMEGNDDIDFDKNAEMENLKIKKPKALIEHHKKIDDITGLRLDHLHDLHSQLVDTLEWIKSLPYDNKRGAYKSNIISWTSISNAEIHIMRKLEIYLKQFTKPSRIHWGPNQREAFRNTLQKGYQCTTEEMEVQSRISNIISMDICSEIEWYKVAQLGFPTARNIVDVGANKGYLGSLFLSLWGGGDYGVSPAKLFELTTADGTWAGSKNPAGYCKDGFNRGIPLTCATRDKETGACSTHNPIHIYSFDGSSFLTNTMNQLITSKFDDINVKSGKTWKYYNFAVSDSEGTARFTKQGPGARPGFEGGKLRGNTVSDDTEEVKMIKIDDFVKSRGITELDILKIDAEGNDNKVIIGAKETITSTTKLFTFEAGKGVSFTKSDIDEMDALGYSCFSTSRAGLFKWNGGCMDDKFKGGFSAKDKGNVFCIHRIRAPYTAIMFDALSFPVMMTSNGINKDSKDADFVKGYVHVKPWCQDWPSCA